MQDKTQNGTQMISPGMTGILNVLMNTSEQVSNIKDLVNTWLDGQSSFAMKVAQLTMTRRAVILFYSALIALMMTVLLANVSLFATFVACIITAVQTYRFNKCVQKDEKGTNV